ncbi:MAG: primosomal protein N' [Clostridia bacterium]|nr:primosomal protein N' [Clostridia bacterium]
MKYAKVAVEAANYSFDMEFTYSIPRELEATAQPGCRVTVPFGNGNRKSLGIIFELTDECEAKRIKKITEVKDESPLLNDEMIRLARFISERTFCTLYEAAKSMLPAGINYRMVKYYAANPEADETKIENLEGGEKEIFDFLLSRGEFVREDLIYSNLSMKGDTPFIEALMKKKLVLLQSDAVKNLGDLTAKMVRPVENGDEGKKLSKKQQETFDILKDAGAATVRELCYFTGYTPAVVNALVKNGYAEFYECEVDYFAGMKDDAGVRTAVSLTEEQQRAKDKLSSFVREKKRCTALLYGVTGSGKTSVYMSLMDDVIDSGKSVLLLVPEIGLTPQALGIFCKRYGKRVAVFHSALSIRERSEQWKRVKRGECSVVIGTRSAVFAPLTNLGLIIIDEEQEHTYKSEQTPRYDAEDVAKFRSAFNECPLVLASATPRVESYAKALKGRYELCRLTSRYGNAVMPDVLTVDMRTAEKMSVCTEISKELYDSLKENLELGKQSILLINRRGYNTFAVCDACSQVITCPNCSISMTYHSANNRLLCHYCGYSMPFTGECPECHEQSVRYAGFGTQKIQDELQILFPEAKILRMDADTTTAKDSHGRFFGAFEKGDYDILIGTQMVAKGLDFPNVTLVGVISVDQQLYNDDFRSLEKTFSLLTQVVGRSGRGNSRGKAIIQTLTPENEIIRIAAKQNYDEFFNTEIRIRKAMKYPPFCDLFILGLVGVNEAAVHIAANNILELIRKLAGEKYKDEKLQVLGPVPARVSKVGGKFRYRIIIKCINSASFRAMMSEILKETGSSPSFKNVTVYGDMNPDSVL